MIRRLLWTLALLPAVAFAAQAPDTSVVTGPNFQQLPLANSLVTPDGGTQTTLGAALAGGALPQIPTLNVLGNVSGSSTTPVAVPLDNSTLITSGGKLQVNTGTSGATVPLNNGNNTQSGAWTFGASTTTFGGNAAAPVVHINGAAGSVRGIQWDAAGLNRWKFQTNASDDLNLFAYAPTTGTFLGTPFALSTANQQVQINWQLFQSITNPTVVVGGIVGVNATYNNTSGNNAQGTKHVYNTNAVTAGFDIGEVSLIVPTATTGFPTSGATAYQAKWLVGLTPNDNTSFHWGLTGQELDVVNRGGDNGWTSSVAHPGNVLAYLAVPESSTFGQGGSTFNADFAFVAAPSAAPGTSGLTNRWYNAFLCEANSEASATGRCMYAVGDVTGLSAQFPYGPFGSSGNWLHGFDTTAATFVDGMAYRMATGQALAWPSAGGFVVGSGSGGNGTMAVEYSGTGEIDLRDTQANPRAKMTSTTVDLGISGTGANFRVANTVANLVTTDIAGWSAGAGNNVITDNVAIAPDGTTTAALMATSATNNNQTRFKTFTGVNGTLASFTVYAASQPATTYPYLAVTFSGTGFSGNTFGIVVNTTTCSFANYINANPVNAPTSYQTTSVGNGWCRVSMQERVTAASAPWVAQVGNSQSFVTNFAGDGTGIYVWQPIVETVAENFVKAVGAVAGGNATLTAADSGDTNASVFIVGKNKGGLGIPLTTPASSADTCAAGQIDADTGFIYICTAANTWKRAALSTF